MSYHMEREIRSQDEAWRAATAAVSAAAASIAQVFGTSSGREVWFVGAGSSYYLGLSAAVSWGRRGFTCRALPASELLLHGSAYPFREPPVVVAVSRSGATTETTDAMASLRRAGSPCIVLTTEGASDMAAQADLVIEIAGGREESVVQTRSFSGHLVAAQALAAVAAGDAPALAALEGLHHGYRAWIERADDVAAALATSFERAYLLGTGERWGLALEGALKLKEASLSEAEAFGTFEFRHGPKSMVDDRTLVVVLLGDDAPGGELAVAREARALGARVLVVAESHPPEAALAVAAFRSGLGEELRSAYYLPLLQLLAYHRSVAKGLDPDHPRHLDFAVRLERS
jgi:glutamine---fructose-6-phosphate transaminase (isomerizing)